MLAAASMESSKGSQLSSEKTPKECTMCGDVGFSTELFFCTQCRQRYQHKYCSDSYPKSARVCNWCLHGETSTKTASNVKRKGFNSSDQKHNKLRRNSGEFLLEVDRNSLDLIEKDAATGNKRTAKLQFSQQCNRDNPRGIARRYKLLSQVSC